MINKTCYFCVDTYKSFEDFKHLCNADASIDEVEIYADKPACKFFHGNADWLYIEQLEKENEELKKELVGWRSSHNWSGKVPEYKTESTTNNDYVVITNTNNEAKP